MKIVKHYIIVLLITIQNIVGTKEFNSSIILSFIEDWTETIYICSCSGTPLQEL